jgi:hypothetical protein
VQRGQANLVTVDPLVALGIVPEVIEEEQDLGREWYPVVAKLGPVFMADEKSEEVGFPAFRENVVIRRGFVANRHLLGH